MLIINTLNVSVPSGDLVLAWDPSLGPNLFDLPGWPITSPVCGFCGGDILENPECASRGFRRMANGGEYGYEAVHTDCRVAYFSDPGDIW